MHDERTATSDRESPVEESYRHGGGHSWLAIPFGAALAGFLAAFLRHRRS